MAKEPYGPIDPRNNMSMWKWNTAENLKADSWVGRSGVVYPGSGYNVTLAMDPEQARKDLKFLDENRWMDLATRAVFVELLVTRVNRICLQRMHPGTEITIPLCCFMTN
jgi:hypothetical protein